MACKHTTPDETSAAMASKQNVGDCYNDQFGYDYNNHLYNVTSHITIGTLTCLSFVHPMRSGPGIYHSVIMQKIIHFKTVGTIVLTLVLSVTMVGRQQS